MNTDQLLELRMEIMESERQAQANRLQRYGSSRTHCAECGEEIPQARQLAVRGVRLCIDCQELAEMKGCAMAEVNKEELRRMALDWIAAKDRVDATDDDDDFLEFNAVDEVWQELADGRAVLSLLDENAAQAARIAELECDKVRLESEAMYGAAGFQAARERIVELEKEGASLLETFVIIADHLGIDCKAAQKLPGKPSQVFIDAINKREESLRAELEACRKDAERYRWLRRGENYAHQYLIDLGMENLEGFDRSIDAAMAKEGGV